jgi:protein SCO1/2
MSRLLSTICACILFATMTANAQPASQDLRWSQGYLPNAPVVTQHGQSLKFYDDVLKGKIAVISFIYTSCRDICPVVTARLSQLEDKLGDVVGRDIFFVSISIDPMNDTPEKLKEYADAFQTGPGWSFLTGKTEDMQAIRYKLGERSAKLTDHRNEVLLFNDSTGEWERASAFGDLNVLAMTVRAMDPAWRAQMGKDRIVRPEIVNLQRADESASSASSADGGLPGQVLFAKICASCHTVGRGDKIGPDLGGVTARRSRTWLTSYIMHPERLRAEHDPTAHALAERFPKVRMPTLDLSENDASDVIAFIEAQTYAVEADKQSRSADSGHGHHHHHH